MTGTPDDDFQWRRTTILLRADLYRRAREKSLDIGQICNQALAGVLGMDLTTPQKRARLSEPVMVAPEKVPVAPIDTGHDADRSLHPVVNANDPAAVRSMLKAGRKPRSRSEVPAGLSARDLSQEQKKEGEEPTTNPVPAKEGKRPAVRRGGKKEDPIKKFITGVLLRGEPDDAVLPKDELYDLFVRWCKEKRIRQAPDRKHFMITLKNQYALREKTINGIPCWLNVRVQT